MPSCYKSLEMKIIINNKETNQGLYKILEILEKGERE